MRSFLLTLAILFTSTTHAAVGVYNYGGNGFQFITGSLQYVRDRISGRPGAQSTSSGCCAGGLTGYYDGRRYNWGTACAGTRDQALAAAASACRSNYPGWDCDRRQTSHCD